jgi:hypothetical protein
MLPASAGWEWCPFDPVVNVAGIDVNVVVSIPNGYQDLVSGPIEVQVATRAGVQRSVVSTDEGVNGYGEHVQFIDLPFLDQNEMLVSVQIPLGRGTVKGSPVPVQLTLNPAVGQPITVSGTTTRTWGKLKLQTACAGEAATAQFAA